MAYTKLDGGITESTIWQAPDATRLVWITLLARVDQNGYVGASMPGLAGLARVPLDACIAAIALLEGPDVWSRTKDYDGRRIAPADGGWVLLNHAKYRALQNADDRRERSRLAMAALRNKRKQALTVNGSYQSCAPLPQAEATTEEGKEKTKTARKRAAPAALVSVDDLIAEGVTKPHATDWLATRKGKGLAPLTSSIWAATKEEAAKANLTPGAAIARAAAEGWGGFKAKWVTEPDRVGSTVLTVPRSAAAEAASRARKQEEEAHAAQARSATPPAILAVLADRLRAK